MTACPGPGCVPLSLVQKPGDQVSMVSGREDAESQGKVLLNEKAVLEISHLELRRSDWGFPGDFLQNIHQQHFTLNLAARSGLHGIQHTKRWHHIWPTLRIKSSIKDFEIILLNFSSCK